MIHQEIENVLKEIKGDYFDEKDNLISNGWLSSIDLVDLINRLEKRFEIKIRLEKLSPEDFDSISGICSVIERYGY